MTTWAIGDLQGCYDALQRLLATIRFDPAVDRLWFTGDLVNRGPDSLACLRFVRELGESAVTVLGNHDLHLLAIAAGVDIKPTAELERVLEAPDAGALLDWLRHRPLLHHDAALDFTMVHAGLAPQWTLAEARVLAGEVETVLRADRFADFFHEMYGDRPAVWSDNLTGIERLRFIVNALTRMRFVDADGRLELHQKGPPGAQPAGLMPWFEHPARASRDERLVTGHWAALGAYRSHNVHAIDGGCVWGRELVALNLEAPEVFIRTACARGAES